MTEILFTSALSIIAMILVYIDILQLKLMDHNVQNSKLLDGMHEGLLILSQSDK